MYQRAIPVFDEIDYSLGLDPKDVERNITKRIKVITPVHLRGVPCKMDSLIEISQRYGLREGM